MVAVPLFRPFVHLGLGCSPRLVGSLSPSSSSVGVVSTSLYLVLQCLAMAFRALGSAMSVVQMMLLRVNLASLSVCKRVHVAYASKMLPALVASHVEMSTCISAGDGHSLGIAV